MHPNPIFRKETDAQNIAFAQHHSFGTLAVSTPNEPVLSHIPFLLSDDGTLAEFHLVRSNPIARLLTAPLPARLAIQGPNSYVSPDWYEIDDQVPTWNYVSVHLIGDVELRPLEELRDLLDRQSAQFEHKLLPKTPWTTGKMTPDVLDRMMRQIVPCRLHVKDITGTWKLSQNKADSVREKTADQIEAKGLGTQVTRLASFMRDALAEDK